MGDIKINPMLGECTSECKKCNKHIVFTNISFKIVNTKMYSSRFVELGCSVSCLWWPC